MYKISILLMKSIETGESYSGVDSNLSGLFPRSVDRISLLRIPQSIVGLAQSVFKCNHNKHKLRDRSEK